MLLALVASMASAQSILVTTGEHANFTRLVLQSSQPISWQLQAQTSGSTARTLSITEPNAQIDISRAFQRIPRSRLSNLTRTQEGLELQLNCDCPITAWTEREGLVVLDIGNPQRAEAPSAASLVLPSALNRSIRFNESDLARSAGITLALAWSADAEYPGIAAPAMGQGPMPSPIGELERRAIMQQLSAQVAGAMTQGILAPSHDQSPHEEMIRLGDGATDSSIPPNLRIMSVLDRPDDDASLLPDDLPNTCAAAASLDFAIAPAPVNFNAALAAGLSGWIGEFDQPEQNATEELVILYLQHGFGAEARALLENALHPVPGRDLLLGFADTLEGRQSNSRLRLAEQHSCGGAAAMLAALAGAPLSRTKARAREIASTYAQAPGVLRIGLGGALIRVLVEAEAIDAGRVVADTLRRTPQARDEDLHMADAILDRARGETLQAGARLSSEANDDIESVLLRLQIALETSAVVPDSALLNAEAISSMNRSTPQGTDLMGVIIRLRVNAGKPVEALALLDRLEGWEDVSTQGRAMLTELADMIWFGLALQASDPELLENVLNRSDWRNPSFSVETRMALAERLLGFGLTEAAESLLATPRGEAERQLLARLHLEREEPERALAALADDQSDAANNMRAQALHALGESRASSQAYAQIGAFDAAARIAVLGRDWEMLQRAWRTEGTATQRDLARALAGLTTDTGSAIGSISDPDAASSPAFTALTAADFLGDQIGTTETVTPQPSTELSATPESMIIATSMEPVDTDASPTTQPRQPLAMLAGWDATLDPVSEPNAMDRSAMLLTESEELRAAFAPLLSGLDEAGN